MDNRNGETPVTPEEAARHLKDAAGSAAKDVKNAAMSSVENARTQAGEMGATTASRLRELAGQVEGDLPWLSGAFNTSAEGLDSVTGSLTRGDMSQTLNSLSDFARRQPALFIGASVALGFALSRVGKTAIEGAHTTAQATPDTQSATDVQQAYAPVSGI